MTTVQVYNRFGDIVGLMTIDTAMDIYRFINEARIRQSLEINRRAIGYAEDNLPYRLVVCA